MDSLVKIAIVQFSPTWNAQSENYKRLGAILSNLVADIIILPELCTTGYSFLSPKETFEQAKYATDVAPFFQSYSNKNQSVIIAGFVEKELDKVYNSVLMSYPIQPKIVKLV